jgi:voltage-gated sodium channel
MKALALLCQRIAASPLFQNLVFGLILLNALLLGIETSQNLMARYGQILQLASMVIQALFVIEIAIRLGAFLPRVHEFFHSGWNVFDFVVVALSLLPQAGPFATIARLARVLRVSRLVSVWPELRLIIGTMLRSIPSMGHVIALLSLLLYVYGVIGFHLFHERAPQYWGSLPLALETLFQTLTLEGWVEVYKQSPHPMGWVYFSTFIVVAVFVVTNLFIAVVINNLDKVRSEQVHAADEASPHHAVLARIEALKTELDELEAVLRREQERAGKNRR